MTFKHILHCYHGCHSIHHAHRFPVYISHPPARQIVAVARSDLKVVVELGAVRFPIKYFIISLNLGHINV